MKINNYYDLESIREQVAGGRHRDLVGGLWDEIGRLALDYLVERGLTPEMSVLDVGCGSLRVGVPLVDYLEPGRYWGVDLSPDLLDAGYERELGPRGLQSKLPRQQLLCEGDFDFARLEGAPLFDVALAQSLFTHLPLNHVRLCLARLAPAMAAGGRFYATIFHCRDDRHWAEPIEHEPGGVTSHPARDPYHYRRADLEHGAAGLPWSVGEPADWGHPRAQAVVTFTRDG